MKLRDIIYTWACVDDSIKNGEVIDSELILLNLRKIKHAIPKAKTKENITITRCHFVISRDSAKKQGVVKEFDLMLYRDDFSYILKD